MVFAKRALVLVSFIALTGCSQLMGFLKPGGITANTQLGKENTQQIVGNQKAEEITLQETSGETQVVKAETAVTAKKVDKYSSTGTTAKGIVSKVTTSTSTVQADKVEQVKTSTKAQDVTAGAGSSIQVYQTQNEPYPFWLLALLVLGWILPTPFDMMNWVLNKFKKSKDKETII